MKVYLENRHKIANHNIRHAKGEVSYSLAMNHFGDVVISNKQTRGGQMDKL